MIRTAEMMMDDRRELRRAIADGEVPATLLVQAYRQIQVLDRSIIAALVGRQIFINGTEVIDTESDSEDDYVQLRSLPEPRPSTLPTRSLFSYGHDHENYDYHMESVVQRTQCGHRCSGV